MCHGFVCLCVGQVGSIVENVVKEGPSKEMTFNHGPKGAKGASHGKSQEKAIPGKEQ